MKRDKCLHNDESICDVAVLEGKISGKISLDERVVYWHTLRGESEIEKKRSHEGSLVFGFIKVSKPSDKEILRRNCVPHDRKAYFIRRGRRT